jgi:predicted GIY-YIG superfamily endonuclease
MKPFWVYILRCADNSYYTGHTDNLELRIGQHQTGACDSYTAKRLPVQFIWSQECATREEALSAELQIKGWSRKKKEAMIRGDWNEVSRLAKSKSAHASTSSARTDLQAASHQIRTQQSFALSLSSALWIALSKCQLMTVIKNKELVA